MRNVYAKALSREVSALGFGCAPLGSMVSAKQGQRAIGLALDLGVTWFDVAPSYGGGNAETLLGEALLRRRGEVVICTKLSALPIHRNPIPVSLRPAARWLQKKLPTGFRSIVSRKTVERPAIQPSAIEESLTQSLKRLRTDYVDVFALHEPYVSECIDPEIINVLARVVQKGYARSVAIAGPLEAVRAGIRASDLYRVVQLRDSVLERLPIKERVGLGFEGVVVTHGAFSDLIFERRGRQISAALKKYSSSIEQLALNFAFCKNPDGVLLVSMFSPAHVRLNCEISGHQPNQDEAERFLKLLAG